MVVAVLGAFLLTADPRRDWNRVFSLFALFWGLQIVAANAVRLISHPELARAAGVLSLALLIPVYFFLVVFAAIFPRPRPPFGTSWPALLLLLLPAAIDLVLLLAWPHLLLEGVAPAGTGSTMQWGPLFPVLVLAPHYGGFFYALFVMMRRLRETERSIERHQVVFVLTALVVYVAYNAPLQLVLFGSAVLGQGARQEAAELTGALIGLIMLTGVVLLVALAVRLARSYRHSASRQVARETRFVLVALLASALVGIIEGGITVAGGERPQMVGLVRAVSVGLIAYGIARFQLFDIDLRVKHATRILSTLVILLAGGVAAWSLLREVGFTPGGRALLVALLVLVAGVPVGFAVRRLVNRLLPHADGRGDHLYLRKLQVYQAALETGDQAQADRLLRTLGLTADDHAVAERLVAQRHAGSQLAPGTLAFDRYLVDAVLGTGAYGRAFLARDVQSGRGVVIKELEARWRGHPTVFARFLREAKIMGRLRHPRIVALLEVERRNEDQYLVLEHVEGGNLAERLAGGRLPVDEALALTRDILDGLEAAHRRGVVHRDLKPANVLLDMEGRAKLADFGVAGLLDAAPEQTLAGLPAPGSGQPVGNLLYMAPEQAAGAAADPRSDLYAVGAMLYHMLTGRAHRSLPPDVPSAQARVVAETTPALDGVPAMVRPFLTAALAPEPGQRPADAAALRGMLPRAPTRRGVVAVPASTRVDAP